jgi:serine/threonine protein kinase
MRQQYFPWGVAADMTSHPNRNDLAQYLLGAIGENDANLIERHLDQCPACEATIDGLNPCRDTVIEELRAGEPADPFAAETECRSLLNRMRQSPGETVPPPAGQSPPASEGAPPKIESLREYRLAEKIGSGGMGTVYRAVHSKLGKVVALKLLSRHRIQDAAAVARFEREMRAVGKLEHPNIVRATDAGECDGMHYLVMELVEGIDIARLCARYGPLGIAECCEIARQAAWGLQHAFERGLVHRDIKPSNLMLARPPASSTEAAGREPPPVVKILDMGLALLDEGLSPEVDGLTASGNLMGTVDYMAPEQAMNTHAVDIRADIYSLGATLYRMLTGQAPFSGPDYDTCVKKLVGLAQAQPPALRDIRPDVPPPLAALVHRLMARRPEDRPAQPKEVAALLASFCGQADLSRLLTREPAEGAARLPAPLVPVAPIQPNILPQNPAVRRPSSFAIGGAIGGALLIVSLLIVGRFGLQRKAPVNSAMTNHAATEVGLAMPDSPNEHPAVSPPRPDRGDRDAAAMVLARGGKVGLGGVPGVGWVDVSKSDELPATSFDLVILDIQDKGVTDDDLAKLDRLPHFTTLTMGSTPISDVGIARMGTLPKLTAVYAGGTHIGDEALRLLAERYATIDTLHAGGTQVTDVGVPNLLKLTGLRSLRLENPAITDASLETLSQLKKLRILCLQGTQISREGIELLRQALPHCGFETSYGNFDPHTGPPPVPDRAVAEWAHALGGELGLGHTAKGYVSVKPNGELPTGYFEVVALSMMKTPIRDSDLAQLDGLENLTTFIAHDTRISDAGLAQLGELPQLNKVYISRANITGDGLRILASRFPGIRILHAGDAKIADDGLPVVLAWPEMTELSLRNCHITDASVAMLLQLKQLRMLHVCGTQISRDGIERLHQGLPECRVESDFGNFGPTQK